MLYNFHYGFKTYSIALQCHFLVQSYKNYHAEFKFPPRLEFTRIPYGIYISEFINIPTCLANDMFKVKK
jgi:hypothetical protein